ncbi:TonB-dependent receptor plug domain-containing protein, partial [Pseudoalteromonas issachenkonii]
MNTNKFKKSPLAASVSLIIAASTFNFAYAAQENTAEPELEVIEVKGIRGSLIRSMDVKRDASGVVDAISAEEMGKFPDTNLAESLQRITGVSVSRSNGEGSQI